eukprot:CAMPEP_0175086962 /NCGR_PEP_ID=MMETSP0052_2-20121109/29560_1 /TAXON_ID=51329 ORGANISM="Polytomella parva, Strain SAG 63-3" /NCGR_SAMPLE_ID=MMETSP0052_2 /ASSEMBLY_ACC=CAM_ASM_000194 /LENGTH=411 /DNA_ID=CAMNT_0016359243 /DNA_START=59 /DNA_END=1291 /DNA_ORIENTATION=-
MKTRQNTSTSGGDKQVSQQQLGENKARGEEKSEALPIHANNHTYSTSNMNPNPVPSSLSQGSKVRRAGRGGEESTMSIPTPPATPGAMSGSFSYSSSFLNSTFYQEWQKSSRQAPTARAANEPSQHSRRGSFNLGKSPRGAATSNVGGQRENKTIPDNSNSNNNNNNNNNNSSQTRNTSTQHRLSPIGVGLLSRPFVLAVELVLEALGALLSESTCWSEGQQVSGLFGEWLLEGVLNAAAPDGHPWPILCRRLPALLWTVWDRAHAAADLGLKRHRKKKGRGRKRSSSENSSFSSPRAKRSDRNARVRNLLLKNNNNRDDDGDNASDGLSKYPYSNKAYDSNDNDEEDDDEESNSRNGSSSSSNRSNRSRSSNSSRSSNDDDTGNSDEDEEEDEDEDQGRIPFSFQFMMMQ